MPSSLKRKRSSKVSARQKHCTPPVQARNRERVELEPGDHKVTPTESAFMRMDHIDELEYETLTPMRGHGVPAESVYGPDINFESEVDTTPLPLGEPHVVVFRPGDTAVFASEYDDTPNIWVGIITDLRVQQIHQSDAQEDAPAKVWLKVKWGWSGRDLATLIKSFNAAEYAPFERTLSEYMSIENARTIAAMEYLHEWDEHDLNPPELQPTTLFTRATLHYSRKSLDPRPGHDMCIPGRCRQTGYVPFPLDPQLNWDEMIMHFCPRLTCRTWYHRECLIAWDFLDDPTVQYAADRGVRLLTIDPDSEHDYSLLAFHAQKQKAPSNSDPDSELGSDNADDSSSTDSSTTPAPFAVHCPASTALPLDHVLAEMAHDPGVLSALPRSLIRLAQCPIVRRPGPARDGWLPAGNVKEVVLARRLVYAAIEGDAIDGWPPLGAQELTDRIGANMRYASPYAPFWAWREAQLERETWMETPPVVCPKCGGAI